MKKPKKGTLQWYKLELDRIFSIYIRLRDDGVCYTCGSEKHWKYQQNGHYISRGYLATRFDEENCHCQCFSCNIRKKGNYTQYALNLTKQYGSGILKKLDKKKDTIVKLDIPKYKKLIRKYEKKIKKLNPNVELNIVFF